MAPKRMAKATKRRLILFGIPAFLLIGYFIMTAFTYAYQIINLERQTKQLNSQLELLKSSEQDLKIELQKLNNPEYIARYARENYLYSKDGEYIIKIEKTKDQTTTNNLLPEDNYQYLYIGGLATLAIMVVIRIRKHHKKDKKKKA